MKTRGKFAMAGPFFPKWNRLVIHPAGLLPLYFGGKSERIPTLAFLGGGRRSQRKSRTRSYDRIGHGTVAAVAGVRSYGRGGNHIFRAGVFSALLLFPKTGWGTIGADGESVRAFLAPYAGRAVGLAQLAVEQTCVFRCASASAGAIATQRS